MQSLILLPLEDNVDNVSLALVSRKCRTLMEANNTPRLVSYYFTGVMTIIIIVVEILRCLV